MLNQFNASLWGDEAFSAILAQKPLWEIVITLVRDTSPPGYYFLEHFWLQVFGTSEVAIRSLSFVLFLVTVLFVYKIGEFVWDKKTGLVAAMLTFLNPFLFIYAFEGRMYMIMTAGVTASMYFFLTRNWVLYIIATTIALYSHHFAIFAVFVQGIWWAREFVWGNRKIAASCFKSFLMVGLLYLPWVYPLYSQTRMVGAGFWLGKPTLQDAWELIRKFLSEASPHKFATPALYLFWVTLLFRRWGEKKESTLFFLAWFLVPIALTYLISQPFQSIFFDRYMLYTIPGAMLVLASNRRRVGKALLVIAAALLFIVNWFYFTHPTKRPFRELAQYVKQTQKPGDFLVNHNAAAHHLWESKYYDIPAPIWVTEGTLPFYVGTALMEKDDIIRTLPSATRIGVITSGNLAEVKLADYTQKETKSFGPLTFAWYEKHP
ncbi:glycosyltransferase family 39 protein [Candidatus Microgenomates bacterium]|nr:glycosyltransferase family 39 protein [Candidatus Microgenomates bacterium]